ncbi:ABC transporter permease [Microbacterium sp. No. 7]|uniref:ABC transporter permease n=1 Tax=Microbacterium sp. No. 7 TaxID=1714373 RepID=UPI0006D242C2|nr:ABC transporter permease subunit [Microbacterium sp. No. 7]ALJ22271.1 hypothetical protein AOA12_21240 [Microbacterium sp. No. 7]
MTAATTSRPAAAGAVPDAGATATANAAPRAEARASRRAADASSGAWRRRWRRFWPPAAALLLGIALWQLVIVVFDIPGYLLPSPQAFAETLWEQRVAIWEPTRVTMTAAYLAFLLALVVGVAAALLMARWNLTERALFPYLVIVQTIPIVAIAPLFVVWIGAGLTTNMLIGAMLAVFPIAANTLMGLKSVDRNLVQLYAMAGAPPRVTLFTLRLPGALPSILTGMRIAAGASVIGAIVGEFVAGVGGGEGGLGFILTQSAVQMRISQLFVAAIMASLVSLLLFAAVVLLERVLLGRWHESALPHDD